MASSTLRQARGILVTQSILIRQPPKLLFRFWRDLHNLPAFMPHIVSVHEMDDVHSHWVVQGPAGARVEWDARIINEAEDRLIAWQSDARSSIRHAGSVEFAPAETGGATTVTVTLRYDPPAGEAGTAVAMILGSDPARQVADDLARLKRLMEVPLAARQER
jgi:uncharacterized membrane protein